MTKTMNRTLRRFLIARAIRRMIGQARAARAFVRLAAEPAKSAPSPTKTKLEPGRQRIAMASEADPSSFFGTSRPWKPPIPAFARSGLWEDLHRFAPGAKPKRDPHYGLMAQEPPLALICPACELEQTPIVRQSNERRCGYCGLNIKAHGTRLFWWREAIEVPKWSAKP